MELSKKDRVFLINQYTILKHLLPDSAAHYDELIQILQHGYQVFYSMLDEWIAEDMDESKGTFVLELLDIYRMIEDLKHNHPGDPDIEGHAWSSFRGFDGNNEAEYLGFTRFLIDKQRKFTEQEAHRGKTDNFNSHMPVLEKYRRMVGRWREMGGKFETSKEHLLEILNS